MVQPKETQLGSITVLDEDGSGTVTSSGANLTEVSGVTHDERSAAPTTGLTKGAFWVEDTSPTLPKFTDSDGTTITLGESGGGGTVTEITVSGGLGITDPTGPVVTLDADGLYPLDASRKADKFLMELPDATANGLEIQSSGGATASTFYYDPSVAEVRMRNHLNNDIWFEHTDAAIKLPETLVNAGSVLVSGETTGTRGELRFAGGFEWNNLNLSLSGENALSVSSATAEDSSYYLMEGSINRASFFYDSSENKASVRVEAGQAFAINIGGVEFDWPMSDGTNGQVLTTNGSGDLTFEDGGSGGGNPIVDPSVINTNTTISNAASASNRLFKIDSSLSLIQITFPATGFDGEVITVKDYNGSSNLNNIIVAYNIGQTIDGAAVNNIISNSKDSKSFVFESATNDWILY